MKKSNLKWFKNNKKQIEWANRHIGDQERQIRLKEISQSIPANDYSTFTGIINLLRFLEEQNGGKNFIDRMANTWSKLNSNKSDARDSVQLKISTPSHTNLKFLAKELKLNKSEFIEHLIEKEVSINTEEHDKYKDKVDRIKKQYQNKRAKDILKYTSGEKVSLVLHDEVKKELEKELEKTKDALRKVTQIIDSIHL